MVVGDDDVVTEHDHLGRSVASPSAPERQETQLDERRTNPVLLSNEDRERTAPLTLQPTIAA